jgi:hypothetical protein
MVVSVLAVPYLPIFLKTIIGIIGIFQAASIEE